MIWLIFLFFFVLFLNYFLKKQKENRTLKKSLNYILLIVTLPRFSKDKPFSLSEYLKLSHQFFESLANLKEKRGLFSFFPVFVFEIAVPRIGEEISFYVSCLRSQKEILEKLILSFWPQAQIQTTVDYNIFNPQGVSLGSLAKLKKSPILPLKPSKDFVVDPLLAITSPFGKLAKEGEGAAIQIIVKKSKENLGGKIKKAIFHFKQSQNLESAVRKATSFEIFPSPEIYSQTSIPPFTSEQQEIVSLLDSKASKTFFDVNLRILVSAHAKERAEEILTQLENSFSQFGTSNFNQLVWIRPSGQKLQKLFYHFSFRIFDEKTKIILSSEELGNIFHFPSPQVLVPQIKWLKSKQVPAPLDLPGEGIIVGKNVFREKETIVRMLKKDRERHFYIIGQTGTGKSALIQEMIRQDIENGEGVGLIDPHGDLAERVLGLIPSSRIEDVIYFDPSDPENAIGLNILEENLNFPESKTFVVNELLEIFEKLYNLKATGFGGPIFEQYMRNALLLVMEDPESGNTLIEVPRVLADPKFRKFKLSRCKNVIVKNFWELEAEKAGGELALANLVPYITSKMNIFIANDLVRPIIAQQKSTVDFREIMDSKKIFIANLAKGRLGDINSYLLGMIIVGKILVASFSRINFPEEKRTDFYLYIDEFHNVTTKTIASALAEARKFKLNLILAHQYIGQLDEETKKAIFGNVGSILAFRVGPDDAKYLLTYFEPAFDENDLVSFENYHGALKLLVRGEPTPPFSIVTFPPKTPNLEIAKLIKEYSRAKYTKKKKEVELEIYERLKKSY
ncbi:type IV secretion system DNA-binding domain-containing protein [Candidatus Parcubacteria bacterium]|nr:type IV secretion system DNA-binding domain-containing protein [Candidatus Parcubacteria bacterium]